MYKTLLVVWLSLFIPTIAHAVTLTWQDNSTGELGFKIERAPTSSGTFAQIGQVGIGVTTYVDAAGVSGNCYRVLAYNQGGNSPYSNVACVVALPIAPTGLTLGP